MKKRLVLLLCLQSLLCSCGNIYDGYLNHEYRNKDPQVGGYFVFTDRTVYRSDFDKSYQIAWVEKDAKKYSDDPAAKKALGEGFDFDRKYVWVQYFSSGEGVNLGFFKDKKTFFASSMISYYSSVLFVAD